VVLDESLGDGDAVNGVGWGGGEIGLFYLL
jgi:hypothetical protein